MRPSLTPKALDAEALLRQAQRLLMTTYRQIVLASRPEREVRAENFLLQTVPVPSMRDGEVLVRNHYLSLDPYMRGRMDDARSYAPPQPLGEVMVGGTAGEVVESRSPAFKAGDKVVGMLGWAEMGVCDARSLHKVDTTDVSLSAYLGPAGMPGITAWYGLSQIMEPKEGQTIAVSAAAGAVGSVVGQLAKVRGCRAIGIAGGPEKCAHVVRDLGFDACIDYKAGNLKKDLKAAAPKGIDAVFENVAGEIFDACLARMNPFGRVAFCGFVAGYEGHPVPINNTPAFLTLRLSMRGFIVTDHLELWPHALRELVPLVATGKLKYRETIAEGLPSAPAAFIGLLHGKNLGKQLVKLV
jgi:NADPH-dependent curcumin reductase CurA